MLFQVLPILAWNLITYVTSGLWSYSITVLVPVPITFVFALFLMKLYNPNPKVNSMHIEPSND